MPNQPDICNRNLCLRVSRELYYKIKREARERKMDMTEFVRHILNEEVFEVELSPEEIRQIASEVRDAKVKRDQGKS